MLYAIAMGQIIMLVTGNDYSLAAKKTTSIAYPTTTTIIAYRTSHFDTQYK